VDVGFFGSERNGESDIGVFPDLLTSPFLDVSRCAESLHDVGSTRPGLRSQVLNEWFLTLRSRRKIGRERGRRRSPGLVSVLPW
jgi:hypothetical protein